MIIQWYPGHMNKALKMMENEVKNVDLIISGHAHGGQWRVFGRGIFAPGQGLFPKYTSGLHEGRLIISRGTSNTGGVIPRIGNPCEVVCITINE